MSSVFIYLHVLSAIMMGGYLLLPFLAKRVEVLSGQAQYGFLHVLFSLNRVGQLALVISFLSGGYLVSQSKYTMVWMVLAVVLFLALGALTGILGKKMRSALAEESGSQISRYLGSIKTLSLIIGLLFFVTVTLMKFPMYA